MPSAFSVKPAPLVISEQDVVFKIHSSTREVVDKFHVFVDVSLPNKNFTADTNCIFKVKNPFQAFVGCPPL